MRGTLKNVSWILIVAMFISIIPVMQKEVKALTYGDYEYEIQDDGTVSINRYYGNDEVVNVPSQIDGHDVKKIGYAIFSGIDNIKEIILPNGLVEIENAAFTRCTSLEKVDIPDTVEIIGGNAFNFCSSLREIELPNELKKIEVAMFSNCDSLEIVEIPYGVESIGAGAFSMCVSLKKIIIPNSINIIYSGAFSGCTSISEIEIPDSVETIYNRVFENCDSIEKIYLSENIVSIDFGAFSSCDNLVSIEVDEANPYYYSLDGNLYSYSDNSLMQYAIGKKSESFSVPRDIVNIAENAFSESSYLKKVNMSNKVVNIEERAFSNCDKLTKIKLSNNIESVGEEAFSSCTSLSSIKIPKNITEIGEDAIPTSTTIYSYPDSLAQTYAEENGNQFVEIGVKHITESPMELVDGAISFSLFKESPYASWEVFGNEGEKCAELINVEVGYGNNGVVMNENSLIVNYEDITEGITFEKSEYKSFIIPNEVVNSWEDAKINKMDIYLPEDEMGESCYISSVFGRTSGAGGKYIDLKREELKIIKGSKQDIIVSAVGVEEGDVYYILQDDTRKLTSDDGKFASEDLYNTLKGNIVTYAYVKKADGTITDPIELMLEKQELSEEEEAFLQLDGFNLFGDESSIEIADEVPIIGGAEITMDSVTKPIGIAVNDGKIRISLGVDIFEKDDGWGEELKWKEFKESFDTIDEVNDGIEDSLEALDAFDELAQSNGVKIDKGSEDDYSINVMGYAEGVITQDGIVFTDVGGQVAAQFVYEYTRQSAMWVLPTYFNVEFEGETCVTFDWFRVVPDSSIPLQFDFVADINPTLKLGGGIGVKDAVSAGLYGQGSINSSLDVGKKYAFLELEGEIGLEGEFFIISGSESIISGKVTAFDGYLGNNSLSLYSNNIINNRKLYNPLDSNIKYSLVSRDYLNSTSKWLSGSNVDEVTGNSKESGVNPYSMAQMDSAGVLNNRGASEIDVNIDSSNNPAESINVTNLQTNVYKNSQSQIVKFGNSMMMAWIEDDPARDDYNRMRLVYSVYDSENDIWSEPKAVFDNGCLDATPSLASDGENVYIAWQNIDTTIVSADENAITEILENSEIMFAKYDSIKDKFCDVKKMTDDTYYDYAPSVSVEDGKATVYWVSNDTCDFTTQNHSIIKSVFGSTNQVVYDELNYIVGIDNTNDSVIYLMDTDGNTATSDDVRLYSDGMVVSDDNNMSGRNYVYGKFEGEDTIFYTSNSNLYYVKNGESIKIFDEARTIQGDLQIIQKGNNALAMWTELTDGGYAIAGCEYANGKWSKPVQLYCSEKKITNFSGTYYMDSIRGVFNSTEQVEYTDENGNVYNRDGNANLCQIKAIEFTDLNVKNIFVQNSEFIAGSTAEFSLLVENKGTKAIRDVEFFVSDENGNESVITKDLSLASGDRVYVVLPYQVPENFGDTTITVTASVVSEQEAIESNNSVSKTIGYCDVKVESLSIEEIGEVYKISAVVINDSGIDVENVSVDVIFKHDIVGDSSTIEVGELNAMQRKAFDVYVSKDDIVFEDSVYMVYLEANTSSAEYSVANNDSAIAITDYTYYEYDEVTESEAVEINGFQMNVYIGGLRTVYSIESKIDGKQVEERGLVYGLKGYASTSEMRIDENNEFVMHVAATSKGVMSSGVGTSPTATSYVMTMTQDIDRMSVAGLCADYYVRGYAKLSDGSCVYSPVYTYSIFSVAKMLYDGNLMNSEERHSYLYDKILLRVEPEYVKVDYDQNNTVVSP